MGLGGIERAGQADKAAVTVAVFQVGVDAAPLEALVDLRWMSLVGKVTSCFKIVHGLAPEVLVSSLVGLLQERGEMLSGIFRLGNLIRGQSSGPTGQADDKEE